MPITSFSFFILCFFSLLCCGVLHKSNENRKSFLLVLSYYFYMTIDWRFAGVLFGLSLVNFIAGSLIAKSSENKTKKFILFGTIFISLSVLFYFKYLGFFIESFYSLLQLFGINGKSPFVDIILPIGISFMTFQAITYPLDLYSKKLQHTSSFKDFLLFMSFFPQVLSGPIVRASFFMPQLESDSKATGQDVMSGMTLVFKGLIKKVVFADILAVQLVDPAFNDPSGFSSLFLILALFAYSFQVYMDLSGYTDIAIGVARMLGYKLPINFNRPYMATSVSNFWQRWHITMSSFFRDYLYEGISKWTWSNIYLNLWIVFIVIGIWHGAGWNFVLYGFIHGSFVGYEHFKSQKREKKKLPANVYRGFKLALRIVQVFSIITITRLLFRGDDLEACLEYLIAIKNNFSVDTSLNVMSLTLLVFAGLLHFTSVKWRDELILKISHLKAYLFAALSVITIYVLEAFSTGSANFIYFQF